MHSSLLPSLFSLCVSPISLIFPLLPLFLLLLSNHPSPAAAEPAPVAQTVTITVAAAAATAPLSPQYTSPSNFIAAMLNSTNFFRYEHSAPFVSYNRTLAAYAQAYASRCQFAHSGGPYGENLAAGFASVTDAVDAWGDERAQYRFAAGDPTGFSEATGHFTQLVWKATTSIGCAAVDCAGSNNVPGVFVVCEYEPAGNVVGNNNAYFVQNVAPQANHGAGFNLQQATQTSQPVATATALGTGASESASASATLQVIGLGDASALLVRQQGGAWWAVGATTLAALLLASGMA